ncbi:MAG: FMN-binding negative transcriptional regulator [Actinomycetia bacterium]|nr:FMN-binding negative transcriptional regulator [Actinomycetes bacterium]
MYIPGHFRLPDDALARFLSTPRPGNLVTVHADGPLATLVPFFFDPERRVLTAHLVRNNPQAVEPPLGPGLVVIDLADAYVSPHDYVTNPELPNVPTWDYISIHAHGPVRVVPDSAAALAAAVELTRRMGDADTLDLVGEEKLAKMSRAIVAVELQVERLEGKAKMSQNRHPDDIESLAVALERQGETEMVRYLREVSLPYAQERYGRIEQIRGEHRERIRLSGCPVKH